MPAEASKSPTRPTSTPKTGRTRRVPSYRLHKATGQGFVEFDGKRLCLGRHDARRARARYHLHLAAWELAGREWDGETEEGVPPADLASDLEKLIDGVLDAKATRLAPDPVEEASGPTVADLVAAWLEWAHDHYFDRDRGVLTSSISAVEKPLRELVETYGSMPTADFGAEHLKAYRQTFIDRRRVRGSINRTISRVRSVFKWGVGEKLVGTIPSIRYEDRGGVPYIIGEISMQATEFDWLIKSGRYPRRSAEIWADGYMSEVALLGRETPRRPLPDLRFARDETDPDCARPEHRVRASALDAAHPDPGEYSDRLRILDLSMRLIHMSAP